MPAQGSPKENESKTQGVVTSANKSWWKWNRRQATQMLDRYLSRYNLKRAIAIYGSAFASVMGENFNGGWDGSWVGWCEAERAGAWRSFTVQSSFSIQVGEREWAVHASGKPRFLIPSRWASGGKHELGHLLSSLQSQQGPENSVGTCKHHVHPPFCVFRAPVFISNPFRPQIVEKHTQLLPVRKNHMDLYK